MEDFIIKIPVSSSSSPEQLLDLILDNLQELMEDHMPDCEHCVDHDGVSVTYNDE